MENTQENLINELQKAKAEIERLQKVTEELSAVREELRLSEERYRTAFEYTGTAMMLVEEDTSVTMGNHRLEEIIGYNHEDIAKRRKWTEAVDPSYVDKMLDYHYNRRNDPSSAPSEYEFKLIDKNGKPRDVLINVGVIPGTKKSLVSIIDISKRKQIESALQISECRYRELFENANDIVYTHDLEGNIKSVNKAALRTYEYSEEELLGMNVLELVDPLYRERAKILLDEKRADEAKMHVYELLTHSKTGKPVWVEVSSRIITENGVTVGVQGIARNITERKKVENELEDSRSRFKEIADLLPGIICEMDTSMKLTYVNEMGLKVFGFTQDDFEKGIDVLSVIPEWEREDFQKDIYNIFHGDFGNPVVYKLFRKDRTFIDALVNSSPIMKNGVPVGIRTCIIDISERIAAEEKLKDSEERFRTIYSRSPIGIALFSSQGFLVDKNTSFNEMFKDRLNFTDVNLFSMLQMSSEDKRHIEDGEGISIENSFESANGKSNDNERYYFDWHVTPLAMTGNGPSMLLAQVQDITERKIAQETRLQKEREATAKAKAMVATLRRELMSKASFHNMVSQSPLMKQIFDILPEVASTAASVLVIGESGTGKELIAHCLHDLSPRKDKPFIAINCSALPDNLLESELFGYKAGAFTDAKKDKPGRFALAEGGTIFLDEIGDISPAMQVKLLRVLQERVYEPLGGTTPIKMDVRVVAATNRDIPQMVKKGEFREDFYYRINVVTLKIPPLRERRCDIPFLCEKFIEKFNGRYGKDIKEISQDTLNILLAHDFPGNIRELENSIEHCFIFCKEPVIEPRHLPMALQEIDCSDKKQTSEVKNFDDLERNYIKSILEESNGNKLKAAQKLGIHKATLFRKLKQLGIN